MIAAQYFHLASGFHVGEGTRHSKLQGARFHTPPALVCETSGGEIARMAIEPSTLNIDPSFNWRPACQGSRDASIIFILIPLSTHAFGMPSDNCSYRALDATGAYQDLAVGLFPNCSLLVHKSGCAMAALMRFIQCSRGLSSSRETTADRAQSRAGRQIS